MCDRMIDEQIKALINANVRMKKMFIRALALVLGTVLIVVGMYVNNDVSNQVVVALIAAVGVVVAYLFTRQVKDGS